MYGSHNVCFCTIRYEYITSSIESWYTKLMSTLDTFATKFIPKVKASVSKHWWNNEASNYKCNAIENYNKLRMGG